MSNGRITIDRQSHILLIGVDRQEKLNSFTVSMYQELAAAYGRLNADDYLRCGVLYAHGKHFSAGLDLPQWAAALGAGKFPEIPEGGCDPFGFDAERRLTKPMLMATQGLCYTIGLELMLATDIRVAARNTRFGQIEIKRGIYPAGGGTFRLFHEVGWGNAMRYLLTGDEFQAEEAYRMGVVQELVEPGEQLDKALALAEVVAAQAPLGVYATLKSARLARLEGETAAAERLLTDMIPLMESEDAQEGLRSFIEKRPAQFKGR